MESLTLYMFSTFYLISFHQSIDDSEKKKLYRKWNDALYEKEAYCDSLYQEQDAIKSELLDTFQEADAYNETIKIYEEQVDLHRQFHDQTPPPQMQK